MTEENYDYRTSQTLLCNQFPGKGKLKIPVIPKFQEKPGDFDDLLLIGFDKTHLEDQNYLDRVVHFILLDDRFGWVWRNPDNDIERLSRYPAVLSPNFSMYLEMAPVMQLYNVFRNRWCGVSPPFCDTIEPFLIGKGGGSAYGADWKPDPDKPNEVILQGPPNTVQKFFLKSRIFFARQGQAYTPVLAFLYNFDGTK